MKLFIHMPTVKDNAITAKYSYGETIYTHTLKAPTSVDMADTTTERLVYWTCIIHSLYLYSIEYFTTLETEFDLSKEECAFFEKLIFNGMAEFRVINSIPIATVTAVDPPTNEPVKSKGEQTSKPKGLLLLNGGGKDGIVSTILLKQSGLDFELFQVGTSKAQHQVSAKLSKKPVVFKRIMDERRYEGKYSGHRPTSSAIAVTAVLSAYLLGIKDVATSNESSANETNIQIDGIDINHQYSKSFEFERDFSELLELYGVPVRYFSILRPIHELQIAKILIKHPEYTGVFISCNHGFRKGFWCMKCAKCAFIALILTALNPDFAANVLGADAINAPELKKHLIDLVSSTEDKPFECVGTLEECQVAAKLITQNPGITLSQELRQAFKQASDHIDDSVIHRLLTSFDHQHGIPSPDYDAVLKQLKQVV